MCLQSSSFLNHLLRRRLDRVPPEYIRSFLEKLSIDVSKLKTKKSLLDMLITYKSTMENNAKFTEAFNDFIRDFVLSAGVSEYLLQVSNPNDVIKWISTWQDNQFQGQKHKFQIHAMRDLRQQFIKFEKDNIGNISTTIVETKDRDKNKVNHETHNKSQSNSIPLLVTRNLESSEKDDEQGNINLITEIVKDEKNYEDESTVISLPSYTIFLVASCLDVVHQLSGLEQVEYHRTTEFEIIFRQDLKLIEIRGEFRAIQDFVTTAILYRENPLSMAASLFVGEEEDVRYGLIRTSRHRIGIEALRGAIDGSFLSMASLVNGSKANRVKIYTEGIKNWDEETEPLLKELLKTVQANVDKGTILFKYKNKNYSFMITKTGGFRFFEYMPEEVVTYLLYIINTIA